ncbi:MAG: hypothetical protein VX293_05330 [Candidatus Latescibacterota bacterium]|nr:hypothetical protein [Candidatus Latescibacterota bacterium]
MDIRNLREEAAPVAEVPPSGPDLDQLLELATNARPGEQARAIGQLRLLVPSATGLERLLEIVEDPKDGRRLPAIQMLGYHRPWLASAKAMRRMVGLTHKERDPDLAAALVWTLRQCDEAAEFLVREERAVAREAALGTPISRQTLAAITAALAAGLPADIAAVLLSKFRGMHPALVRYVVDLLFELQPGDHLLRKLLAGLPQLPLFELFVEAGQTAPRVLAEAEQARIWQRMARIAAQFLQDEPSTELMCHLLSKSGEDESFARRHARFLQRTMQRTDSSLGADLIGHLERLTFRASEDKVARLAQLLVGLSEQLDGAAGHRAALLLEDWKGRSAALKLKIYHLEQGIS